MTSGVTLLRVCAWEEASAEVFVGSAEILNVTLAGKHSFSFNSVNVFHLEGQHAQAGFGFLNTSESPTLNGNLKIVSFQENRTHFIPFESNSKWSKELLTLETFRFPIFGSYV